MIDTESIIKTYGKTITIKGTTDTTTYGFIVPNRVNNIQNRHNIYEFITLSDSTATNGTILYDGTNYYIVMTNETHYYQDMIAYKSMLCLLCNVTATIKRYIDNVLTTIKSNIHCAILKSRINTPDDDIVVRDRRFTGTSQMNFVYMSDDEDLQTEDFIIDGSRTLKVMNDISHYVVMGVVEAAVTNVEE